MNDKLKERIIHYLQATVFFTVTGALVVLFVYSNRVSYTRGMEQGIRVTGAAFTKK